MASEREGKIGAVRKKWEIEKVTEMGFHCAFPGTWSFVATNTNQFSEPYVLSARPLAGECCSHEASRHFVVQNELYGCRGIVNLQTQPTTHSQTCLSPQNCSTEIGARRNENTNVFFSLIPHAIPN